MADTGDSLAARELRASDADRESVAERLREAAGHGRLTMDELEERLEGAYGAKTYAELEPLTRDLPASGAAAPLPVLAASSAVSPRIGGTPNRGRWSVAILSGSTRRGRWVVPARFNAVAFWGGTMIDLRDASFAEPVTVIRVNAVMAGIDIIAPPDVDVRVEGFGLMGAFEDATAGDMEPPPPGAPVVRVVGIAFWAGVTARRKAAKVKKGKGELTTGG